MAAKNPRSVHLGFCHTGTIHTEFALSILAWERWMVAHAGYLPAYSATKNVLVADNRNKLVKEYLASEAQAEWLWILDPDIQFKPDTLAKLLSVAHPDRAQVVAGAYWMNPEEIPEPCLTWHADTPEGLRLFKRLPDVDGAIKIGSCGMGCTLIHRGVFEKLAELHKDDLWTWFGHDPIDTHEGIVAAGEDVTFCRRAVKAGFTVVGHCGVVVEHLKTMRVPHGGSSGDVN